MYLIIWRSVLSDDVIQKNIEPCTGKVQNSLSFFFVGLCASLCVGTPAVAMVFVLNEEAAFFNAVQMLV